MVYEWHTFDIEKEIEIQQKQDGVYRLRNRTRVVALTQNELNQYLEDGTIDIWINSQPRNLENENN